MRRERWLSAIPLATLAAAAIAAWAQAPSPVKKELRFDGKRAFADLEAFVGAFGPRPTRSSRSREVAKWISDRFERDGTAARVSSGYVRGDPVVNTIAMFPGSTSRFIVVLGHHDSVPGAPGAEDNASSVAALLELARALKGVPLRHSVILCATDAEESGGAGAELLLFDLGKERVEMTDACIGLEMLAWAGGSPVMHAVPRNYAAVAPKYVPGSMPAVMAAASPEALPLGDPRFPLLAQAFTRVCSAQTGSDDVFFAKEGVPALFLSRSSLSHFYPHYHKESDTPDKLSAEALHSSGRILESSLLALDEAPPSRDDNREYFLARSLLYPQRLLALAALGPLAACAGLALWKRRADRALSIAAGFAALPCLSVALRFQPLVLLACWLPAAVLPLVATAPKRWERLVAAGLGALPALLLAILYVAGATMFGVSMGWADGLPLLVSGAMSLGGLGVAVRGLREAPVLE
jgi:hypothetical protein